MTTQTTDSYGRHTCYCCLLRSENVGMQVNLQATKATCEQFEGKRHQCIYDCMHETKNASEQNKHVQKHAQNNTTWNLGLSCQQHAKKQQQQNSGYDCVRHAAFYFTRCAHRQHVWCILLLLSLVMLLSRLWSAAGSHRCHAIRLAILCSLLDIAMYCDEKNNVIFKV